MFHDFAKPCARNLGPTMCTACPCCALRIPGGRTRSGFEANLRHLAKIQQPRCLFRLPPCGNSDTQQSSGNNKKGRRCKMR